MLPRIELSIITKGDSITNNMKRLHKPGAWVVWKTQHPDRRFTAVEYGLIAMAQPGYQGKDEYFIYWFSAKGKVKYGDSSHSSKIKRCPAPDFAKDWALISDVFEAMPLAFLLGTPCALVCLKDRSHQVYVGDMKVTRKYVTQITNALLLP